MKTLLVIGAGGFIGGFIAKEGLRRGYEVWAGVRQSTSRRYLDDERLRFAVFDYDDPQAVGRALQEHKPESGRWDCIIWNLGATKAVNYQTFNLVNYQYLRTFVEQLKAASMLPERFLFMSSLSALGPADEKGYTPLSGSTVPNPNTRYGLSKIKAETYLASQPELPWIIFRPTGVYGPHEQDYLMMIKSIDSHFDFGVGFRRQMLTFIYVDDLVAAMFDALSAGQAVIHKKYIISEDRAYTQQEFRQIVAKRLGKKVVIPVVLPLWAAYAASCVSEWWGKMRAKPSTLNRDKYKIMRQRNWACDISDARRDFGFSPQFPLARGIDATVAAYLAKGD